VQKKIASDLSYPNEYLHFISLGCSFGFALTAVSPRGICAILMSDTRQPHRRSERGSFGFASVFGQ
jgi:hypothetical protein